MIDKNNIDVYMIIYNFLSSLYDFYGNDYSSDFLNMIEELMDNLLMEYESTNIFK